MKDKNEFWITFDSSGYLSLQEGNNCSDLDDNSFNEACNESQYFSISWDTNLQVSDPSSNGTLYLNYPLPPPVTIDYVFLASLDSGKDETEWIIGERNISHSHEQLSIAHVLSLCLSLSHTHTITTTTVCSLLLYPACSHTHGKK